MRRYLTQVVIGLLLITIFQPLIAISPVKAQPFTSPGTRYGMNMEGAGGTEYGYVDIMHCASWSYGGSHDALGYPGAAGGTFWFFLEGDPPGPQIYNFHGEGVFTASFTGDYSTNQNWPYTENFPPFNNSLGVRGAVPSSVSILPPNYPGNTTNKYIVLQPNTPGDPSANPPIPANPFPITMFIPPNSPANTLNTVVTDCQVQYNIPQASPSAWTYSPQYGQQGIPLSWTWVSNVNPNNQPGENPANFHFTRPGYPAWKPGDSDYPVTATSYPLFTKEFLQSFAPLFSSLYGLDEYKR